MANQKQNVTEDWTQKVKNLFTESNDIVSVIKQDHKPLKDLIKVMKDSRVPFAERQQAFMEFAPLLLTHAKAEEKALYEFMKHNAALREMAFEGDTEHSMADQLCEEIKRASDPDDCGAKIKVLAEAVEHHIKEEEDDILPKVQKEVSEETLKSLTAKYTEVQAELIAQGQEDSPHESQIKKIH